MFMILKISNDQHQSRADHWNKNCLSQGKKHDSQIQSEVYSREGKKFFSPKSSSPESASGSSTSKVRSQKLHYLVLDRKFEQLDSQSTEDAHEVVLASSPENVAIGALDCSSSLPSSVERYLENEHDAPVIQSIKK
jgi:hypothetical protein